MPHGEKPGGRRGASGYATKFDGREVSRAQGGAALVLLIQLSLVSGGCGMARGVGTGEGVRGRHGQGCDSHDVVVRRSAGLTGVFHSKRERAPNGMEGSRFST